VTKEMSLPSWLSDGKHETEQDDENDKLFKVIIFLQND
jgi:hypothetical protein